MHNPFRKTILLIALLAFPIVLIFLLHTFGENHYEVPVLGSKYTDQKGDTVFHRVGPFELFTKDSTRITHEHLQGSLSLVYFLNDLEFENAVRVVKKFQSVFDDRTKIPSFYLIGGAEELLEEKDIPAMTRLLVGDPAKINQLKNKNFLYADTLFYQDFIQGSDPIFLIDESLRIRGVYGIQDEDEVERLIAEIKILQFNT